MHGCQSFSEDFERVVGLGIVLRRWTRLVRREIGTKRGWRRRTWMCWSCRNLFTDILV